MLIKLDIILDKDLLFLKYFFIIYKIYKLIFKLLFNYINYQFLITN